MTVTKRFVCQFDTREEASKFAARLLISRVEGLLKEVVDLVILVDQNNTLVTVRMSHESYATVLACCRVARKVAEDIDINVLVGRLEG